MMRSQLAIILRDSTTSWQMQGHCGLRLTTFGTLWDGVSVAVSFTKDGGNDGGRGLAS